MSIISRFKGRFCCSKLLDLSEEKRSSVERGGKIIMPPSVLATLSSLDIVYPLLFKLTNTRTKRATHTGVLEFVAEEKKIYLPAWLMKNLEVDKGETVLVENATLPVASYSRFQPQSVNFLDITNPKAVLENYLRQFACLTTGDLLSVSYNNRVYELRVLETRPSPAVNIIECDMAVDFDAPVGYTEKPHPRPREPEAEVEAEPTAFVPFTGTGRRLDGKARKRKVEADGKTDTAEKKKTKRARGVPDYEYEVGSVRFMRDALPAPEVRDDERGFQAFRGAGHSMLVKTVETDEHATE